MCEVSAFFNFLLVEMLIIFIPPTHPGERRGGGIKAIYDNKGMHIGGGMHLKIRKVIVRGKKGTGKEYARRGKDS